MLAKTSDLNLETVEVCKGPLRTSNKNVLEAIKITGHVRFSYPADGSSHTCHFLSIFVRNQEDASNDSSRSV
jgi:hypothetical protein